MAKNTIEINDILKYLDDIEAEFNAKDFRILDLEKRLAEVVEENTELKTCIDCDNEANTRFCEYHYPD